MSLVHHRSAVAKDLAEIRRLLQDNELPTLGIEESLQNFAVVEEQGGKLIGVAGLERFGNNCLLRSVTVVEQYRRQGYGKSLVESVLKDAKAQGIIHAYLLTNTARDYFARLGFQIIDRSDIDGAVKSSSEFSEICKDAVAMHKLL